MENSITLIDGVRIPRFLYGTAWKEDDTQRMTELALENGFRGIDTANQRRHYHEAAVGQAVAAAIARGLVTRGDLFLQTKFTFQRGQDHRLPYDARAPIGTQVEQSFASSLDHLGVETLDSYLLHGPTQRLGLVADDWAAWRAMEAIHSAGRVKVLGVSNVSVEQLELLVKDALVKPSFVQNRCYADRGWDHDVRKFCAARGIVYQGFSLLTANRGALARPELAQIAQRHARTVSQVVFRFCIEIGILPLTGTSSPAHMREDLDAFNFALRPEELQWIEYLAGE
jgi:diketogulonate reductase-like aldo/keto reductase